MGRVEGERGKHILCETTALKDQSLRVKLVAGVISVKSSTDEY